MTNCDSPVAIFNSGRSHGSVDDDDLLDEDCWLELVKVSLSSSLLQQVDGSEHHLVTKDPYENENVEDHRHIDSPEVVLLQLEVNNHSSNNGDTCCGPSVLLQVEGFSSYSPVLPQQSSSSHAPPVTNNITESHSNKENSKDISLMMHPIMYQYLHSNSSSKIGYHNHCTNSSSRIRRRRRTGTRQSQRHADEDVSLSYEDVDISIVPLPMLSYQIFQQDEEISSEKKFSNRRSGILGSFTIEPITVSLSETTKRRIQYPQPQRILPKGSSIVLSWIFSMDNDKGDTENEKNSDQYDKYRHNAIAIALEGRWIKKGCTLLLSAVSFGLVLVEVTDIILVNSTRSHESNEKDGSRIIHDNDGVDVDETTIMGDKVYRFGSVDDYKIHFIAGMASNSSKENPSPSFPLTAQRHHKKYATVEDNKMVTTSAVPGYESLLEELVELCNARFDENFITTPSARVVAAPSAIMITGYAGVGKSRMVSCLVERLMSTSASKSIDDDPNNHKKDAMSSGYIGRSAYHRCCFMTVQDLIFRASVEGDLLINVIVAQIDDGCTIWVIDDMHLLERETASDDVATEDGMVDEERQDAEYMMVQNAIVDAVDRYQHRCIIIGLCRAPKRLPHRLTKIGRFEKVVTMLPPTQVQRFKIWKSLLSTNVTTQDDDPEKDQGSKNSEMIAWAKALTSMTSGCVASDLHRILRDAQTRRMARSTTMSSHVNDTVGHLILAGSLKWVDLQQAAKTTIPSQLSELDVISPHYFSDENEEETVLLNSPDNIEAWKEIHEYHWKAIGGYSQTKRLVYRHVVVPWKHFIRQTGGSFSTPYKDSDRENTQKLSSWPDPPSGVLFHGPSGTGKSTAARCLAASLGLPLIQIRASDVLDRWLGGSEALIRSIFSRARAASPCILLLDEIDAMASNRETDETNDFGSRILSTLLNEMDGVSSSVRSSQVLVVGCTNRIESIDSALLRPGRLQEHFLMDFPNFDDTNSMLRLRLKNIPLDKNVVLEDVSQLLVEKLATGADVEGICREVCFLAMRRSDSITGDLDGKGSIQLTLSMEDFTEAIDNF